MRVSLKRGAIGAALFCVVAGLWDVSPVRAEQVEQGTACAWTNGPTVPNTGCSYNSIVGAPVHLGFAAWVGGSNPSVTGPATGTSCTFLGGGGGVCIYTTTPSSGSRRITVNVPSSTAGVAGDTSGIWPTVAISTPQYCTWSVGTYGCSITRGSTGRQVIYGYVLDAPTVTGIWTPTCGGVGPRGAQVCTSTSNNLTVTAGAPFTSAGFLIVF